MKKEAPKEHTNRPQGYAHLDHLSKSSLRVNEFFDPRVSTADLIYAYAVRCLYKRSAKAGTYNLSRLSVLQQLWSEDERQLYLFLSHLAFPISPLCRPLA